MTKENSRAQRLVGDVAPKLAELTDEALFGDVWARPGLSPRDRSLVTVATLAALGRTDQLRSHLGLALDNGMTRDETGRVRHPRCGLCGIAGRDERRDHPQAGPR
jgi:4-carboxymuconolactone decarboxylase